MADGTAGGRDRGHAPGAAPPDGQCGPARRCMVTTLLVASFWGTPFLGIGAFVFWVAVLGGGALWYLDLVGSAILCAMGAYGLFGASCLRGRKGGGERAWLIAAGMAGGVVLPAVATLATGGPRDAWRLAALLAGWGTLVAVALRRARRSAGGRGGWGARALSTISVAAGRTGAAVLLVDAIDRWGFQILPRVVSEEWGSVGVALGLVGVLLMDEQGFVPWHRMGLRGCGRASRGCVLGEWAPQAA